MDTKDNGGAAFPCEYEGSTRSDAFGMTLRDYFAAKAMQSLLGGDYMRFGGAASDAYRVADAMLEARKQ